MSTAREITNHLARLLREEQGAMADFLLALADFDRKKLWRELDHTSLFYFLHRELRLSKGAAQNRKTAAELIQAFPEVEAALRAGELCLSTVNELAKVLTPENRAEVLPRFFGLSRREAEAVVVSLRPAEVVPTRDVITAVRLAAPALRAATALTAVPVVSPESPTLRVHPGEPQPVADEPTLPVAVSAAIPMSIPPPPRQSVDLLDGELARVHITVSRRFLAKLEAAKDALSHAKPGATAEEILEAGLDLLLERHAKRKGLVAKPQKDVRPSKTDAIPAHVKRAVWQRAGGRCEWRFESGERCGSTTRLEFDHHNEPRARGGPATIENIRLHCRPHNLLSARRVFGDAVMDRYTRRPSAQERNMPFRTTARAP